MAERIVPGPVSNIKDNCEAVCIHTKKIYDSCREINKSEVVILSLFSVFALIHGMLPSQ